MNGIEAGRSRVGVRWIVAILLGLFAWGVNFTGNITPVLAQAPPRSVQGRVVDQNDVPIRSAIVYLSDTRTLAVESYITQEDGNYRFEQLSPSDDYKLWAQADGKKSKPKILSSFDDKPVFRVIIRIDTGK
ncbi:MAG: carboxypeptidase-like regulatory domain-containing protein [Acidobacteriaceae bacterium]